MKNSYISKYAAVTEKFWRCCYCLKYELARLRAEKKIPEEKRELQKKTPMTIKHIKYVIRNSGFYIYSSDANESSLETFEEIEDWMTPIGDQSSFQEAKLAEKIAYYALKICEKEVKKTSKADVGRLRHWARRKSIIYTELGKLYMQYGDKERAKDVLEPAVGLAERLPREDYMILIPAYLKLALVYQSTFRDKKALDYFALARGRVKEVGKFFEGSLERRKALNALSLKADSLSKAAVAAAEKNIEEREASAPKKAKLKKQDAEKSANTAVAKKKTNRTKSSQNRSSGRCAIS